MPAIQRWPVLVARGFRLHQAYRPTLFATQCLARPIGQYGYATTTTTKTAAKTTAAKKKSETESVKRVTSKKISKKAELIEEAPVEQYSIKPPVTLSSMRESGTITI